MMGGYERWEKRRRWVVNVLLFVNIVMIAMNAWNLHHSHKMVAMLSDVRCHPW